MQIESVEGSDEVALTRKFGNERYVWLFEFLVSRLT